MYTETYLQDQGWSTYTCPHATLQWEGGTGGWNDAFAAPNEVTDKKEGGFDIVAERAMYIRDFETKNSKTVMVSTLWQVKKTKANPFTPKFKREIKRCVDYYNLVPSACFGIWWPNGHGPKGKPPVIWRADE